MFNGVAIGGDSRAGWIPTVGAITIGLVCMLTLSSVAAADEPAGDEVYERPAPSQPAASPTPAPTPAPVEDPPDYTKSGWIVGFGGLGAIENFKSGPSSLSPTTPDPKSPVGADSGAGYFLRGGYRFAKWWQVEIDHEGAFFPTSATTNTDKTFSFLFNLKAFLPIGKWIGWDRLQAYGFGGAGVMVVDSQAMNRTGSVVDGGIGLATFIREDLSVVLDASYVAGTGRISDTNYVSIALGFEKRF